MVLSDTKGPCKVRNGERVGDEEGDNQRGSEIILYPNRNSLGSQRVSEIESYEITPGPNRGICLIINNIDFHFHNKRVGSEVDGDDLEQLFHDHLGYKVIHLKNLTAAMMTNILKSLANNSILEATDSLFIIILSHGTTQGIYGVDGGLVELDLIIEQFDNRNCKHMREKPKVRSLVCNKVIL